MNDLPAAGESEVERAARAVAALDGAGALCALVFDVVSRQAEGGTLFSGEKFIEGRAEAHGVTREAAETPLGNVLSLLERGPETALHWALLSALFARGFADAVRAKPGQRKQLCAKLAVHCAFLEVQSPYRVLAALPHLSDAELAGDVYAALGELVLDEDAPAPSAAHRARNAGRIAALEAAAAPAARAALERVEREARDGYSRALASLALGRAPRLPEPKCILSGRAGRFPRGAALSLLSWLSGFALLRWIGRVALSAIGCRREVELELLGEAVRVRKRMRLLGRVVRDDEQVHPVARLCVARRSQRYPALQVALGACSFALGLLLGGLFVFDAFRVGDGSLWAFAALFLLGGAALDLAFGVVIPGRVGRVVLDLDLERRQRISITGVPIEQADALLAALARQVAQPSEVQRGLV
jgi:hypothetical protein